MMFIRMISGPRIPVVHFAVRHGPGVAASANRFSSSRDCLFIFHSPNKSPCTGTIFIAILRRSAHDSRVKTKPGGVSCGIPRGTRGLGGCGRRGASHRPIYCPLIRGLRAPDFDPRLW